MIEISNKKIKFFDSALGKALKAGGYAFVSSIAAFVVLQLESQTGIVIDATVLTSLAVGVANALIYGSVKFKDPKTANLPQ